MENSEQRPEEILKRLGINIKTENLKTEEELDAIRKDEIRQKAAALAAERWKTFGAPKRLRMEVEKVQRNNEWGLKAQELKQKIGTGTTLVFRGPPGTGKSQMGVELCRYAIFEKAMTARFVSFAMIQLLLKTSFSSQLNRSQPGGEFEVIQGLMNPQVLVIDEFDWCPSGAGAVTESYWQNIMYNLIDYRWGEMLDTVLTSNKTREEFENDTLKTVKSRITQTGGIISTDGWTNWRAR